VQAKDNPGNAVIVMIRLASTTGVVDLAPATFSQVATPAASAVTIFDTFAAANSASIHITDDAHARTWHATMNTTADEVEAAPEVKYPIPA
jgi:hypothetical protein